MLLGQLRLSLPSLCAAGAARRFVEGGSPLYPGQRRRKMQPSSAFRSRFVLNSGTELWEEGSCWCSKRSSPRSFGEDAAGRSSPQRGAKVPPAALSCPKKVPSTSGHPEAQGRHTSTLQSPEEPAAEPTRHHRSACLPLARVRGAQREHFGLQNTNIWHKILCCQFQTVVTCQPESPCVPVSKKKPQFLSLLPSLAHSAIP